MRVLNRVSLVEVVEGEKWYGHLSAPDYCTSPLNEIFVVDSTIFSPLSCIYSACWPPSMASSTPVHHCVAIAFNSPWLSYSSPHLRFCSRIAFKSYSEAGSPLSLQ